MSLEAIVFDFDGTLIDSQEIKIKSFCKLFQDVEDVDGKIVNKVLKIIPEESRYVIIETILKKAGMKSIREIEERIKHLADKYNSIVLNDIKKCKEKEGASNLLRALHRRYSIYLCSVTPIQPLRDCVKERGWNRFFIDIFGYPTKKINALKQIVDYEKINPGNILVVGDGETDKNAAASVGCHFYRIKNGNSLKVLKEKILGKNAFK